MSQIIISQLTPWSNLSKMNNISNPILSKLTQQPSFWGSCFYRSNTAQTLLLKMLLLNFKSIWRLLVEGGGAGRPKKYVALSGVYAGVIPPKWVGLKTGTASFTCILAANHDVHPKRRVVAIISPLGVPNSIALHGLRHFAADGIPPNGLAALPCTLGNAFGRIHRGEKPKILMRTHG